MIGKGYAGEKRREERGKGKGRVFIITFASIWIKMEGVIVI